MTASTGSSGDSVIRIGGGTFTGGTAIGIGTTSQVTNVGPPPERADLRTALEEVRERIVAGGRDESERIELRADVQAILRELERDEPRPAVVRSRWDAVRAVLGKVLDHSGELMKITEIVANQFAA
ncbi:hypothetical protein [Pseudonocardia parietis]|uniref:Uncharacterized protein n=1 Tax=Pseudonocardia parietis TaxID=570936 RepID=A0ABS4W6M3_9PSEU|nr:hypothetical protein [Pseudonocardia parietis]MBP2371850.1 hypothetical protein [Pseudonocardia parietis]